MQLRLIISTLFLNHLINFFAMVKFNNRRVYTEVPIEVEDYPPYLVPVNTGEEVIMLPESDNDRGIPADAYSLQNQLADGISLKECPTYMQLAGVHGADVATRIASSLHTLVENTKIENARSSILNAKIDLVSNPAPSSAGVDPAN